MSDYIINDGEKGDITRGKLNQTIDLNNTLAYLSDWIFEGDQEAELLYKSGNLLTTDGYTKTGFLYENSTREFIRLSQLGFHTFLIPGSKASNMGFINAESDGVSTSYPSSIISEGFTRANSPESSGESGAIYIDENNQIQDLNENQPNLGYKIGGRDEDIPFYKFLSETKNYFDTYNDISGWSSSNLTLTNSQPDPFGGNNAILLESTSGLWVIRDNISGSNSGNWSMGVWVKAVDENTNATFRLSIGGNNFSGNIEATSEWQFVSHTVTNGGGSLNGFIRDSSDNSASFYVYAPTLINKEDITFDDFIPCLGTSLTRNPDVLDDITDLQGAGLITSSSQGSIFMQLTGTPTSSGAAAIFRFGENDVDVLKYSLYLDRYGIRFYDYETSGGGFMLDVSDAFGDGVSFHKAVLTYDVTTIKLFVDGVLKYEGTAAVDYTTTSLTTNSVTTGNNGGSVRLMNLAFGKLLSDEDAKLATQWNDLSQLAADLNYDII